MIPDITNKVKNTLLKAESNIRDSEVIDRSEDLKKQSQVNIRPYLHQMIEIPPMDTQMENLYSKEIL